MLSRKVLHYVDRLLRDVCGNNQHFGGKNVLLGGDWKQLPPVVEHGTREDQINDSIKLDPLFCENFETLRFVFFYKKYRYLFKQDILFQFDKKHANSTWTERATRLVD